MKALLILGMHRSGTSALAGHCASLGIWFGNRLLPPRPDNPKGYFEAIDVMLANDQLVTLLFGGWHSPLAWSDVERSFPLDHPRITELQQALRDALRTLASGGRLWAVKDPRLSRLLPVWWPLLRELDVDAGIVMAVRRPAEVIASLEQRDCIGPTTARLLWLRHVAEPLAYALDYDLQIAVMPYHELLIAPERVSERLRSIGLAVESQDSPFVDATLRHHADVPDLDDALGQICEQLYHLALSAPVFSPVTASAGAADAIRAARNLPVAPYIDRLYFEALGVSNVTQRLFQERKQASRRTQERALRQRLANKERALARLEEQLAATSPNKSPGRNAGARRR
jgi:hypothetical protein